MNLLKKYKKMKFIEKQDFLELLLNDLQSTMDYKIKLKNYMRPPELKNDLSKDKS